jgi:hypothetical protein
MILRQLKEYAESKAGDTIVTDVRIGLCYTAALLNDGSAGVAYTFKEKVPSGCDVFQGKRPLAGKKTSEILPYLESSDVLERAVGLAAANAIINSKQQGLVGGDIAEVLTLNKADTLGMIGYFAPLMPVLQTRVKNLLIFENVLKTAPGIYPEDKAQDLLPSCTIAIITATALLNDTAEPLLKACRNCRQIAILGATTPLAPEIFKPFGVTLLSGVVVTEPHAILQCVSEGSGMGSFRGHIKKVNLPV